MDDETKKSVNGAIEQLFAAYGAVDDKLHNDEEGKDYGEVAEEIEASMQTLKSAAKASKE